MEELFDKEDVRFVTLDLMKQAGNSSSVDEELAKKMGENYFELRKSAALKFTSMVDKGNSLVPVALPVLSVECDQANAQKYMATLKSEYEDLVDFLVTMYLLRGMEKLGKVDNPFTVEIGDKNEVRRSV